MVSYPSHFHNLSDLVWWLSHFVYRSGHSGRQGEILGRTAAIKAFAFGMIAFAGGGMQTFDESVPLIASFLLMTVCWLLFQTQIPKTAFQGVGSRWQVAKA
jgi:hypothetical protein